MLILIVICSIANCQLNGCEILNTFLVLSKIYGIGNNIY